jgi:hypothetical protein
MLGVILVIVLVTYLLGKLTLEKATGAEFTLRHALVFVGGSIVWIWLLMDLTRPFR